MNKPNDIVRIVRWQIFLMIFSTYFACGQTLYVPGGTPWIYPSTNGNVGISTSTPLADLHVGNTNGGGIRIGAVNDGGNLSVALGALTGQYNLDFSGYRDTAPNQIGARIAALRFNNYGNNTAYVQTTGLAFYTNPSGYSTGASDLQERMRITPTGKVGIGTNTPLTDLHLGSTNDGGIRIGKVGDAGTLAVAIGAQTVQYNLDFSGYRDNTPDQIGARISALRFNNYGANNALIQNTGLAFYTNPYGSNSGTTDLQERMRITPAGKVGIGTTAPLADLHLGSTNDGGIRIGKVGDAGNLAVALGAQTVQYNLDFSGYRDNTPDQIGARISALRFNNYGANNALVQTAGLAFYTNPTGYTEGTTGLQERMRVAPDGNVGIGTTSPDAKLAVNGTIHSKEVKVDMLGWSDYVFDNDYNLLPLDQLQTYINENKHLPDVPSETEVLKNGQDLGAMNAVLLRKIEELTLYVIDTKNQMETMKKELQELKNKK